MASPDPVAKFIDQWSKVEASEKSVAQHFLLDLCDLLEVGRPTGTDDYKFERTVPFSQPDGKKTTKFIDLYKRGCFVLEAKKYGDRKTEPGDLALLLDDPGAPSARKAGVTRGTGQWDAAMQRAYEQAEWYAHHLHRDEPSPLFLIVVDVGHVIELYADFSGRGRTYSAFPDVNSHRIRLADLTKPRVREKLARLWSDPAALDPSLVSAEVTRKIAEHLAALAISLEKAGHPPKLVAEFLCRCLFCMFAEDVELLPKKSFSEFLESLRGSPGGFVTLMEALFREMDQGATTSTILRQKLLRFNGGLFREQTVLPVNGTQLGLLIEAARCDWRDVEPAIFGTLLERALNPEERGKLGAHFTPRAYVERLVLPTVIDPLREDWRAARDEAVTLANRDDLPAARKVVLAHHEKLCAVRVLDPACGSGNFLYVTLEHLKRLEGEVLELLRRFGSTKEPAVTVDPHQLLGLELNERAVPIAELVLWIGYLQWHFRVHGKVLPAEPVLKEFKNIQHADAVLTYDRRMQITQKMAEANPKLPGLPDNWREKVAPHTGAIFVWDRKSYKKDPATGREVPDESRQILLYAYQNPRPAEWPAADFIVGNPPFIGTKRMREALGDGYVSTLRAVYGDVVEDNADFVMYWWYKAAEKVLSGSARRFGLITTNSIRQSFSRRVVHNALQQGVSLRFAIPDHPWVDTTDGAAVRIAMTVGALVYKLPPKGLIQEPPPPDPSALAGDLYVIRQEAPREDGSCDLIFTHLRGRIGSGLNIGAELEGMSALRSTEGICGLGVALHGSGFILEPDKAGELRKYGAKVIKPYLGGSDLLHVARERYLIDFSFMEEAEARAANPQAFDHVVACVRPERVVNRRENIRKFWWRFGWERPEIRKAITGLPRYIATTETAKHRIFQFLDGTILPDHMVIIIASSDSFHHGALSSHIHTVYALAAGGTLEDRPRYNKTRCFDPFPFPDCTETQKAKIRKLAEELDAHRKRAQQKHGLGLTDIYNVLEKVRQVGRGVPAEPSVSPTAHPEGSPYLSEKEKLIHDAALVATLKQLHDDLDKAVADAYGWPWPMPDPEILKRVVALNAARAAEEKAGVIRWLRPDYQAKGELMLEGCTAHIAKPRAAKTKKPGKLPWPAKTAERTVAVETALAQAEQPLTATELTKQFSRAKEADVQEVLDTLCALGRIRPGDTAGTYVR